MQGHMSLGNVTCSLKHNLQTHVISDAPRFFTQWGVRSSTSGWEDPGSKGQCRAPP